MLEPSIFLFYREGEEDLPTFPFRECLEEEEKLLLWQSFDEPHSSFDDYLKELNGIALRFELKRT